MTNVYWSHIAFVNIRTKVIQVIIYISFYVSDDF